MSTRISAGAVRFGLRKSLSAVLAACFTIGLILANTAPASAAGYSYDGTDPAVTGCATGSVPISSGYLKDPFTGATSGQWEVRYSSSCGTNWVRAYSYNSSYIVQKYVQRTSDGYSVSDNDVYAGWTYSRQIYAPGTTCVVVNVILSDGNFKHGEVYKTLC
ncbi:DUF2690 domain-containing protein [Paenarthrobacter sp. RAF9]